MEKELQIRLVKQAKIGDAEAFVKLCGAYQTVLYNSAYKLLADNEDVADCLQETEIRAWKKITNLKNEAAFNSWIFRIMVNIAKGILKRRVESVEFEERHMTREEDSYGTSDLEQGLNRLSEKYKIPLILHYYAGFSIKEIAVQERISANTVKTRLARGRVKLKALLEENGHG
ncbi:sigma-70 family RNA polymerase sigma factor [Enterococcus sp. BWB1-3]|uniref:RNA polymerase sigma factor n=1 Tax=unclassified Enterococcus TaxID=2608891 RepID=UPI0019249416|nr:MULTISPECIES: sigma-70 family RNA polymerase sigma factor [unclassified Enterococcus]MBL1229692.1 sigma-70 family RNA polymerase sigma factor [Enterococcus sp. BWB1-3]MCB5953833.1 sigma-70 family RNA polymerase sigma factor [Enterococcus sp. CWB-B31]